MGNTCLKDVATNLWISMKCIIIAKLSNINVSEVDGKEKIIEKEKNNHCCSCWHCFKTKQDDGGGGLSIRMKISSEL